MGSVFASTCACMHMHTHSSCDQSSTTRDQFYLLKEWLMIAKFLEFYDSFLKEKINVYD